MHVLYVNKTAPHRGGGAEIRIWEVGRRLVQRGHQVSVVCAATEPGLPDLEILDGMRIHYVRSIPGRMMGLPGIGFYGPRLAFYGRCSDRVRRIIGLERVDIVHDDISPFPCRAAVRIARQAGLPVVATVHNLSGAWKRWTRLYGLPLGSAGYLGERWLRRRRPYDHIISASRWMVTALEEDLPLSSLSWIPNGVDLNRFVPAPQTEGGEAQVPVLLYVGRFVVLKGHEILLQAFRQLLQNGVQARLMLPGDGPTWERVRARVRQLGMEAFVNLPGRVPAAEMPAIFGSADIYVSPSLFEGLPLTLLEAMAAGLPIISTRIEAVEGLFDETHARLVAPGAAIELAAAMHDLVTRPRLRRRMGAWGRRQAEQKYHWDAVVEGELALCDRLTIGHGRRTTDHRRWDDRKIDGSPIPAAENSGPQPQPQP